MGNLSIAVCSCGFESKHLYCGGGELNFKTICDAPVICGDCGKVGLTNLLGDDGALKALDSLCCPSCNSPNIVVAAGLTGPAGKIRAVSVWGVGGQTVSFLPGPFRCPSCGEEKLTFESAGCWD